VGHNIPIDRISHSRSSCNACHYRQGKGCSWRGERHAGDKDNGLDALAEDGDEGQDKHGVPLEGVLKPLLPRLDINRFLESLGKLDAPLVLETAYAQQGDAHDGDDERGEERECGLVVVLMIGPDVLA
jgi:hypothetical protein